MRVVGNEACPLPEDPVLAAAASALNDAGYWAEIVDRGWRSVYMTDDARLIYGDRTEPVQITLGAHLFGPERTCEALEWRGGQFPIEILRQICARIGAWALADTPGGRDELRALADPRLRDIVDELQPVVPPPAWTWVF